jgi:hypothetical protein
MHIPPLRLSALERCEIKDSVTPESVADFSQGRITKSVELETLLLRQAE